MRILVLSWRDLDHPDGGGSEAYVHQLALRWVRAGHDVTVRTARPARQARLVVIDGVRYVRAGARLSVYPFGLLAALRSRRDTDAVVDVINGLPFWTPLVRRRGVVALVHHVHREQWRIIYPNWRGRLGWYLESRVTPALYRGVPHVAVSAATRRDLVALGIAPRLITVVRNGLDTSVATRRAPAAKDASPRVAVVSRLVPHKQIDHVFVAAARLRETVPDLAVDVMGSGWWEAPLRARAVELGVDDLVHFHGHVSDEERDRLLGRAWVMVLPSVKEGWGIAVTEAAAVGTPTIGYRSSGGLTESIEDGTTGWLADDLDELVDLTGRALTGGLDLRGASRAARRAAARLDWDASASEFLDVLTRVGAAEGPGQRSP